MASAGMATPTTGGHVHHDPLTVFTVLYAPLCCVGTSKSWSTSRNQCCSVLYAARMLLAQQAGNVGCRRCIGLPQHVLRFVTHAHTTACLRQLAEATPLASAWARSSSWSSAPLRRYSCDWTRPRRRTLTFSEIASCSPFAVQTLAL